MYLTSWPPEHHHVFHVHTCPVTLGRTKLNNIHSVNFFPDECVYVPYRWNYMFSYYMILTEIFSRTFSVRWQGRWEDVTWEMMTSRFIDKPYDKEKITLKSGVNELSCHTLQGSWIRVQRHARQVHHWAGCRTQGTRVRTHRVFRLSMNFFLMPVATSPSSNETKYVAVPSSAGCLLKNSPGHLWWHFLYFLIDTQTFSVPTSQWQLVVLSVVHNK